MFSISLMINIIKINTIFLVRVRLVQWLLKVSGSDNKNATKPIIIFLMIMQCYKIRAC